MSSDRACEALEAQGFKGPGPKLIEHVMDAIAREEESPVGGERIHTFNYQAPRRHPGARGPDRRAAHGRHPDGAPGRRIINEARAYVFDDDDS